MNKDVICPAYEVQAGAQFELAGSAYRITSVMHNLVAGQLDVLATGDNGASIYLRLPDETPLAIKFGAVS